MAISEKTVSNVLHMAADEINAGGGILGKKIQYVRKTAPPTGRPSRRRPRSCSPRTASPRSSAAGPRPAARPSSRSSRSTTACSSTRCSTRALRRRQNIYYTGATTNQQIIPAMDFLAEKGVKTLFLAGSDYVFPRTANAIIKLYAGPSWHRDRRRGVRAARLRTFWPPSSTRSAAPSPTSSSTPSTARQRRLHQGLLRRRPHRRRRRRSSRCRSPRRRSPAMGHEVTGHYAPGTTSRRSRPRPTRSSSRLEGQARQQTGHHRPDGGRLHLAVPVQGHGGGGRLVRRRQGERRRGTASRSTHRRARSRSTARTTTSQRPARIGKINADSLFDIVWSSGAIEPDPFLKGYDWSADSAPA